MNHPGWAARTVACAVVVLLAGAGVLWWVSRAQTPDASTPQPLRVAAAISLQEVLGELARTYEDRSGQPVELTFGSSGQIAAQVASGAPIDLLISAAHSPLTDLAASGRVEMETARIIARNRLVLVVPAAAAQAPTGFTDLASPTVRRLAVGQPETVPAGQYAQQVLGHLGLDETLRGRIVYATNVRQVLSYVLRAEVSAGIVYQTDVRAAGDGVRVVATADQAWHEPIEYPAVIVTAVQTHAEAQEFLEFLASPEATSILRARGFEAPSEERVVPHGAGE